MEGVFGYLCLLRETLSGKSWVPCKEAALGWDQSSGKKFLCTCLQIDPLFEKGTTERWGEFPGLPPSVLLVWPGTAVRSLRGSEQHNPPHPFPSAGRATTHKLKDEEQVREGDEDREATGQGATTRSRCRGHACELASALGQDTRTSGSPLTTRLLRRAQWPRHPRVRVKN